MKSGKRKSKMTLDIDEISTDTTTEDPTDVDSEDDYILDPSWVLDEDEREERRQLKVIYKERKTQNSPKGRDLAKKMAMQQHLFSLSPTKEQKSAIYLFGKRKPKKRSVSAKEQNPVETHDTRETTDGQSVNTSDNYYESRKQKYQSVKITKSGKPKTIETSFSCSYDAPKSLKSSYDSPKSPKAPKSPKMPKSPKKLFSQFTSNSGNSVPTKHSLISGKDISLHESCPDMTWKSAQPVKYTVQKKTSWPRGSEDIKFCDEQEKRRQERLRKLIRLHDIPTTYTLPRNALQKPKKKLFLKMILKQYWVWISMG
eukprot:TRINITY_DN4132_c0_g1_i1.p1 TRINITY_DN4132_c0_g1~~TRINITY_DN4132_c0_g1_i1.p1  ORF type:complete len:313 (-),score=56.10 TRINITY_DN4132_c0_g1_i1:161-1099(-)